MNKGITIFLITMLGLGAAFAGNNKALDTYTRNYKWEDLGNKTLNQVFANTLEIQQLIPNGVLKLDSDSNGVPDGFNLNYSDNISLINGVYTFQANALNGTFFYTIPTLANTYYFYGNFKADSNLVRLRMNAPSTFVSHSGSNEFELVSFIVHALENQYTALQVNDFRTSGFTPISVDYVGAFNVSTFIVNKQYSPLYNTTFDLMTDVQIKEQMDLWVQNYDLSNIPLGVKLTQNEMDLYYTFYNQPSLLINQPTLSNKFYIDYSIYVGDYGLNIFGKAVNNFNLSLRNTLDFFSDLFDGTLITKWWNQIFNLENGGIITVPVITDNWWSPFGNWFEWNLPSKWFDWNWF